MWVALRGLPCALRELWQPLAGRAALLLIGVLWVEKREAMQIQARAYI